MRLVLAALLIAACQNPHGAESPPRQVAAHRAIPPSQQHGLPPSCARNLAYIEQLESCPKLPLETRTAIRDAMAQALPAWRQLDAQTTSSFEDACATGTRALVETVQQLGC